MGVTHALGAVCFRVFPGQKGTPAGAVEGRRETSMQKGRCFGRLGRVNANDEAKEGKYEATTAQSYHRIYCGTIIT